MLRYILEHKTCFLEKKNIKKMLYEYVFYSNLNEMKIKGTFHKREKFLPILLIFVKFLSMELCF